MSKGKLFKSVEFRKSMEKTSGNCEMKIEKIKRERDSWKETALVAGDARVMKSIDMSLKQISSGQGIPLGRL
jgi:hypothetical protein